MELKRDLLKELVGDFDDYEYVDDLTIIMTKCSKFKKHTVCINFKPGILEVYTEDQISIKEVYQLNITLSPLSNEQKGD